MSSQDSSPASDALKIALYRLHLSILPHVQTDRERRERLGKMERLASGLRVLDRRMLRAALDALEGDRYRAVQRAAAESMAAQGYRVTCQGRVYDAR